MDAATGAAQSQGEFTMAGKLRGKVAMVTGGSAGIGLGIAKRFAQEGARVFITGRRQFQLDEAVASIGGDAAAIQGDSTNLADLDRIYATIKAQAAHLDVLMVNAGVYEFGVLGEITEEQVDRRSIRMCVACYLPCKRRCHCWPGGPR
jgi:NAD(P)-dependent dehydrogenase (short-subunit alcohol dehydrogenase family)